MCFHDIASLMGSQGFVLKITGERTRDAAGDNESLSFREQWSTNWVKALAEVSMTSMIYIFRSQTKL